MPNRPNAAYSRHAASFGNDLVYAESLTERLSGVGCLPTPPVNGLAPPVAGVH